MTETFADFHFQPFLMEALKDLHFVKPTPVQEKVIPIVLANKSVVGRSRPGAVRRMLFCCRFLNSWTLKIKTCRL